VGYTPQEIIGREFSKVFKGYDKDEVKSYLKKLSDEVDKLNGSVETAKALAENANARAAELEHLTSEQGQFDALSDHVNEMLRGARGVGDDIRAKAQTEAQAIIEQAAANSEEILATARKESDYKLSTAESEAQDKLAAAISEADRIRLELDADLARIKADADAESQKLISDSETKLSEAEIEAANILAASKAEAEKIIFDGEAKAESYRLEIENSFVDKRTEVDEYAVSKISEGDSYLSEKLNEADAYFETKQSEADAYFESKSAEADEYVKVQRQEADDYVAQRQGEVYKDAETAERERDKAIAEIEDARMQVTEMLEHARAQNEFLRQEAEEVIRTKVRTYIDQTERRVSRLKITEQSSRERIMAAQKELNDVLNSVGIGSTEDLGDGTSDAVIAEAQKRMLESTPSHGTNDNVSEILETEVIDLNPTGDTSNVNFVDLNVSAETAEKSSRDQQTDDALSQLVREAMQQAVDTAVTSDPESN